MGQEDTAASKQASHADLTPVEEESLLLLASFAGKVIWVYARLKGIKCEEAEEVKDDPKFEKKEYLKLLSYYNNLARKCYTLVEQRPGRVTLKKLIDI